MRHRLFVRRSIAGLVAVSALACGPMLSLSAADAAPRTAPARSAPAATAAETAYIRALYQDLLGRTGNSAGVAFWAGRLATSSRSQVVRGIQCGSAEYESRVFELAFVKYLHREPRNPLGRAGCRVPLAGFDPQELVIALSILGDDEYYDQAGATVDAWLAALFADVLGRAPDKAGLAFFRHHYEEGLRVEPDLAPQVRADTANVMLESHEAHADFVTEQYRALLRRGPDPSALDFWTGRLGHGLFRVQFVRALVASNEYYAASS